jgi:hypothetical protein
MTKLTDLMQTKRWGDQENIEHDFTRAEVDALIEAAIDLDLNYSHLEHALGDETATVVLFGDNSMKISMNKDKAVDLIELLSHVTDLMQWSRKHAKS